MYKRQVNNGDDLEARAYVALANTYSGFVETISCCTSEHSIEHALSAFHPSLPHVLSLYQRNGAEAIAAETPLSTSEMNNSKFKINQHVNSIGSAHTAPQENRGQ